MLFLRSGGRRDRRAYLRGGKARGGRPKNSDSSGRVRVISYALEDRVPTILGDTCHPDVGPAPAGRDGVKPTAMPWEPWVGDPPAAQPPKWGGGTQGRKFVPPPHFGGWAYLCLLSPGSASRRRGLHSAASYGGSRCQRVFVGDYTHPPLLPDFWLVPVGPGLPSGRPSPSFSEQQTGALCRFTEHRGHRSQLTPISRTRRLPQDPDQPLIPLSAPASYPAAIRRSSRPVGGVPCSSCWTASILAGPRSVRSMARRTRSARASRASPWPA